MGAQTHRGQTRQVQTIQEIRNPFSIYPLAFIAVGIDQRLGEPHLQLTIK